MSFKEDEVTIVIWIGRRERDKIKCIEFGKRLLNAG